MQTVMTAARESRPIPYEPGVAKGLALLADPYHFIGQCCRRHGSDLFEARIMFHRTICMTGPYAAELFYDKERFQRQGAAPEALRATLFGKGGVQGLDGLQHIYRKAMFMSLMTPGRVDLLTHLFHAECERMIPFWSSVHRVRLYSAMRDILARVVCKWAGVPLEGARASQRSRELSLLFDEAANSLRGHLRSRLARLRMEHWLRGVIYDVRAGRLRPPPDSALHDIAACLDVDRRKMDGQIHCRTAAVELLNVLRPTVAIAVFIVFAAHALHRRPDWRERLREGDARHAEWFVQEVRRSYPFFPAVAARVRQDFEWNGYFFPQGRRVLLDIYGTNHDPRSWSDPNVFRPERFARETITPFNFIPQGGAEPYRNHRCPGEAPTIALTTAALDFLVNRIDYVVPAQDTRLDYSRLPALPVDGFLMSEIRLRS